ncbi:MAG: hypothetical protein ACREOZ_04155 [Gloeomargaritales cyanobacterium]
MFARETKVQLALPDKVVSRCGAIPNLPWTTVQKTQAPRRFTNGWQSEISTKVAAIAANRAHRARSCVCVKYKLGSRVFINLIMTEAKKGSKTNFSFCPKWAKEM